MSIKPILPGQFDATKVFIVHSGKKGEAWVNYGGTKKEGGGPLHVQIGATSEPFTTWEGLTYFAENRYQAVIGTDASWTAARSFNKLMTSRIDCEITLRNSQDPNSLGGQVVALVNQVVDRVADALVHGALPANGTGDRVPLWQINADKSVVSKMISSPLRGGGESLDHTKKYDYKLRTKVRVNVVRSIKNDARGNPIYETVVNKDKAGRTLTYTDAERQKFTLKFSADVINSATNQKLDDPTEILQRGARGLWVVKFNPLLIKQGVVYVPVELVCAKLELPKRIQNVEFIEDSLPAGFGVQPFQPDLDDEDTSTTVEPPMKRATIAGF